MLSRYYYFKLNKIYLWFYLENNKQTKNLFAQTVMCLHILIKEVTYGEVTKCIRRICAQ